MFTQENKPGRPFGLSLAIITVAVIFAVIPLLRIGLEIWLLSHFQNFSWTVDTDEEMIEPIMSGVNFDFDYIATGGQALLAIGILTLCILAWRGRPRWVRSALVWVVLIIDAMYILAMVVSLTRPRDLSEGITSADELAAPLQGGYFILLILTTSYLVWYINREPARAFFRGAFRDEMHSKRTRQPDGDVIKDTGQA